MNGGYGSGSFKGQAPYVMSLTCDQLKNELAQNRPPSQACASPLPSSPFPPRVCSPTFQAGSSLFLSLPTFSASLPQTPCMFLTQGMSMPGREQVCAAGYS